MTKGELCEILKYWTDDMEILAETDFERHTDKDHYGLKIAGVEQDRTKSGKVLNLCLRLVK